jgi:preprotein translocase subunit YajC
MFISIAHAATEAAPTMADTFWTNMGLIGVMFVLFYFLMIRPQQKRLKEQRNMLDTLKKGDKVVTGGGLLATVTNVISDTEVEIDLGGTKVVALRYTIQTRLDDSATKASPAKPAVVAKPATAAKPAVVAKPATKAVAKTAPVKKAAAKKPVVKKAVAKKTAKPVAKKAK